MNKLKTRIWWILACCFALYMVLPVLTEPAFCILDSAYNYNSAIEMKFADPSTWVIHFGTRAMPFSFLRWIPALFGNDAWLFHWYENALLLLLSVSVLFWFVYHTTKRAWLAALAVIPAVTHPAFIEDFYTLFKQENLMLAGVLSFSYVLFLYASERVQRHKILFRVAIGFLALLASMYAFTKESSVGFIGAVIVGAFLFGWEEKTSVWKTIKRTWWPIICAFLCFATVMFFYLNIKNAYNASGLSEYSLSFSTIRNGVIWLFQYTNNTAPYTYIGIVVLLIVLSLFLFGKTSFKHEMRGRIAWLFYLIVLCGAVTAPLLPWTAKDPRYYIVFSTVMPVWTIISCEAGWKATRLLHSKLLNITVRSLCVIAGITLLSHCVYGLLVGRFSEAPVRHNFDLAYDGMFRYISENAHTNENVYFMLDKLFKEPIRNTRISFPLFYDRDDLHCYYPDQYAEIKDKGIVAATVLNVTLNYDRMPLQHKGAMRFKSFNNRMQKKLFSNVKTVHPLYAEKKYHGPQYESVWGVPAFWKLKKGEYTFGWVVYEVEPDNTIVKNENDDSNLIKNARFNEGLKNWGYWKYTTTNSFTIEKCTDINGNPARCIRIQNPDGKFAGVKQNVHVISGKVYRLSAEVRSLHTTASDILFGARVALFQKGQPEKQLVWMSEHNNWWRRNLIFTNKVTGRATVYCSMGYGNIASTGEFTNIRLEIIDYSARH